GLRGGKVDRPSLREREIDEDGIEQVVHQTPAGDSSSSSAEIPSPAAEEPIYALTEPGAVYDTQVPSRGKLRRMMRRARRQWRRANRPSLSDRVHDIWNTPLIDLPVPFAGTITDWWSEPVLWGEDPPEDFVDP